MTAAIYQCGDTIQITEQFYNFLGVLANLTAPPTVTVYGSDKLTVIGDVVELSRDRGIADSSNF